MSSMDTSAVTEKKDLTTTVADFDEKVRAGEAKFSFILEKPLFFRVKSDHVLEEQDKQSQRLAGELWSGETLDSGPIGEIFSFLDNKELNVACRVSQSWRHVSEQLKGYGHTTAMKFKELKELLPPDSLAERLLLASVLSDTLLTDYCREVLGEEKVHIVPKLLPPTVEAPLVFAGEGMPEVRAVPLLQYFTDTQRLMRPFMQRPNKVLPLFHGEDAQAKKSGKRELKGIDAKQVIRLWNIVLKSAREASKHHVLFYATLDPHNGHKTSAYKALINFLRPTIALEGFLADTVLMRKVADTLLVVGALGGLERLPLIDGFLNSDSVATLQQAEQRLTSVRPLLQNEYYIARITPCILLALADFRLPYHLLSVLLQNPKLIHLFNKLTQEELTFLTTQPVEDENISTFASSFQWYVSQNIPIDVFIQKLSKDTLFWLLNAHHQNARLLQSPALIEKLSDAELIKAITTVGFLRYFVESIRQNARLVERMTPPVCIAVMGKISNYEELIFAIPALMQRFTADQLFNVLKNTISSAFLIFAEHCGACLDKLSPEQFRLLIAEYSILQDEETQKARAFDTILFS